MTAPTSTAEPPRLGPLDFAALLARLAELGPPSEIRSRAPAEAASALGFDCVLLSSIRGGMLVADALHDPGCNRGALLAELRDHPVPLEYPLIEGEIMRRRRAQVVRADAGDRGAFSAILGWAGCVAAPIMLDGRPIGFLHAARRSPGQSLSDEDAAGLAAFALCFALVLERAVLRHRLRVQRREMRQVAAWAEARTSELGDRSISLREDDGEAVPAAGERGYGTEAPLRDLLTRREMDVLDLMVRGETNAGIARQLVVSEGTVKFHVKNVLRKLHASNRAEATSRYLRIALGRGG